ncbi:MAG: hypothetical protein HGA63_11105 [Syntrophobacteraceae bacterium]|nr:hypothetical protein [Syntrophobacteraceae bacterium]
MKWMQFLTPVASMDSEEARAYIEEHKEGTYTLLDVRQPSEYEKGRIPGAIAVLGPAIPGGTKASRVLRERVLPRRKRGESAGARHRGGGGL